MITRLVGTVALALASAVALAGCGGAALSEPSSTATPTALITPTRSATPSPTATADGGGAVDAAIVMPTCDQIMDAEATTSLYGPGVEPIAGDGVARADILPGPSAQAALAQAVSSRGCQWGVPNSDGGFHVIVAELPQGTAEKLTTDLRSAGSFTETQVEGYPAFGMDYSTEIGGMSVTYAFSGIEWIAVVSSLWPTVGAEGIIERTMDAWIAANPTDR